MENGALYINSVRNIVSLRNRLSGKIGLYVMPEYTATEIDEPDDWIILEHLMQRHMLSRSANGKKKIKLFLSDVDGVLTDGGMYYSEKGDELKNSILVMGWLFGYFMKRYKDRYNNFRKYANSGESCKKTKSRLLVSK